MNDVSTRAQAWATCMDARVSSGMCLPVARVQCSFHALWLFIFLCSPCGVECPCEPGFSRRRSPQYGIHGSSDGTGKLAADLQRHAVNVVLSPKPKPLNPNCPMHLLGPEDLAVNPSRVKGFQAGSGFRVQGLGFRVQGLGFRV